eukprot:13776990-Alexandrium_andersonii.AAC.1
MGNGDKPQTLGGTLNDARQFGRSGAQSNCLLGRGLMLYCMLAAHAHAPARRPASVEAPRKVRVD